MGDEKPPFSASKTRPAPPGPANGHTDPRRGLYLVLNDRGPIPFPRSSRAPFGIAQYPPGLFSTPPPTQTSRHLQERQCSVKCGQRLFVTPRRRVPHVPGSLHPHPCGALRACLSRSVPRLPKRPDAPALTLRHSPTTSGAHLFGARFAVTLGRARVALPPTGGTIGSGRVLRRAPLRCLGGAGTGRVEIRHPQRPPDVCWEPVWSVGALRGPVGWAVSAYPSPAPTGAHSYMDAPSSRPVA